jgi:hypothetical protein
MVIQNDRMSSNFIFEENILVIKTSIIINDDY